VTLVGVNRALIKAAGLAKRFRELRALADPKNGRTIMAKEVLAGESKRSPISSKAEDGQTGELYIYEAIGFDCFAEGGGVTAQKVLQALDEMKGVKTLNVYVNSEGGDVFEAKAIFAQLQRFPAQKVVTIDGLAASAATLVAMAGDRIVTNPVATWMIHEAWSGAMGNAEKMRAMADVLDLESQTIAETYARQTGDTPEAMRELMLAETWMNAQQALERGFTDEVGSDNDEPDEDDSYEREAKRARHSSMAAAAALTESRIKSVTPAALMAARTQMHRRNHPGQPGSQRPPASR
jgi:ATP-dependent Clp protease protease subunit